MEITAPEPVKTRYSDPELIEFKDILLNKLATAREEFDFLRKGVSNPDKSSNSLTDDSPAAGAGKEELSALASRQKRFIEQLEAALVRIENRTYGICRETGKLIPPGRLRAVPHTTLTMEAKLRQN